MFNKIPGQQAGDFAFSNTVNIILTLRYSLVRHCQPDPGFGFRDRSQGGDR
jgi:hypothetical protein